MVQVSHGITTVSPCHPSSFFNKSSCLNIPKYTKYVWLAPGPAPCIQRQSWSFKALWSFCSWLWGWGMWQDVTVCGGGIAQRYSSTLLSAVWHLNCAVAIRVAALSDGMWRLVFTSVYIVQSCCAGQSCTKPRVAGGRVKMYEPKRIFLSSCAVRRKNMTNVYSKRCTQSDNSRPKTQLL